LCAAGFNAPVAGTFFAIETVLRPQHAENSPPLTTAMIILAAVTSSTVSQALLGEKAAFTVPPYELRSAAGESCLHCIGSSAFLIWKLLPSVHKKAYVHAFKGHC
jgi:H+/Cl- antiporter ClcA